MTSIHTWWHLYDAFRAGHSIQSTSGRRECRCNGTARHVWIMYNIWFDDSDRKSLAVLSSNGRRRQGWPRPDTDVVHCTVTGGSSKKKWPTSQQSTRGSHCVIWWIILFSTKAAVSHSQVRRFNCPHISWRDEAKNKNFNDTQLKVSAYYTWNPKENSKLFFWMNCPSNCTICMFALDGPLVNDWSMKAGQPLD